MTEKEKMLSGQYYQAWDAELAQDRRLCKEAIYDFNLLRPSEREERKRAIKNLFGTCGEGTWIESPFQCDYGYNIHVGKEFFANYNCVILDCAKVTIGDNVLFAPNVGIYTATHPIDAETRTSGLEMAYPITIGNRVWIGAHATILPGVTIGDNSVIGAGSVVTKDIPANVVAVGNPCKVLRVEVGNPL